MFTNIQGDTLHCGSVQNEGSLFIQNAFKGRQQPAKSEVGLMNGPQQRHTTERNTDTFSL